MRRLEDICEAVMLVSFTFLVGAVAVIAAGALILAALEGLL